MESRRPEQFVFVWTTVVFSAAMLGSRPCDGAAVSSWPATASAPTEETFGAECNPTGDPIGGGKGYRPIPSRADFRVKTAGELLSTLQKAAAGQVLYCELSAWTHAAIYLLEAGEDAHIHHSFIHHNQRAGLGYGVCLDKSEALIEANLFDWNRHHIAGTGRPGTSYEARYNVSLEHANSYSFDMHGGRDRNDGTEIGGTWINIHHNTFHVSNTTAAVLLGGIPEREAIVHHNWLLWEDPKKAAWQYYGLDKNMYVFRNVFGKDRRLIGTGVRVLRRTRIYQEGKPGPVVNVNDELVLLDYRNGRFEVEFPAPGGKGPRQRGWIKAANVKIVAPSQPATRPSQ